MKAYEYNHIYKESLHEMLQEGKMKLSEVLSKYEIIDEYCECIGWNEEIDVEKFLSDEN